MGIQIAVRCAKYGYPVCLFDIKPDVIKAAKKSVKDNIDVLGLMGTLKYKPHSVLSRLNFYTDLAAAVKESDLVFDIVFEKLELKRDVFNSIEKLVSL